MALIPLAVFAVMAPLLLPRAAPPDQVPLPIVDHRVLNDLHADEEDLVRRAEREGLGDDTRTLGSELRAYRTLQHQKAPKTELEHAKVRVETARARAVARDGLEALHALFAVQQSRFLAELEHWERTPDADDDAHTRERVELGGIFLERLAAAHWATEHASLTTRDERRVLYKMMWGTEVGLDGEGPFALSLDERRVLYGLFLRAPHAPEMLQSLLEGNVARATTRDECAQSRKELARAAAKWKVAKIAALAQFDPTYPEHYALGIAQLEAGDPAAAVQAFRLALDEAPDGPYALRSRNFLKSALAQANP